MFLFSNSIFFNFFVGKLCWRHPLNTFFTRAVVPVPLRRSVNPLHFVRNHPARGMALLYSAYSTRICAFLPTLEERVISLHFVFWWCICSAPTGRGSISFCTLRKKLEYSVGRNGFVASCRCKHSEALRSACLAKFKTLHFFVVVDVFVKHTRSKAMVAKAAKTQRLFGANVM